MIRTKFSIIIPVYNTEESFLKDCFSSVLNINYSNKEVIIIDDGSNNETKNILKEYESYGFIFKHQENKGLVKSRLEGLKIATGDYIIFLDSDDIISQNSLELLNDIVQKHHPDLFLHDPARFKYSIDKIEFHNKYFKEGVVSKDDVIEQLVQLHIDSLCNKFVRRELFDGIESFIDTSIVNGEDLQQSTYVILKANSFYYIDSHIQYYRLPVVERKYYDIRRLNDINFAIPTYRMLFKNDSTYNKYLSLFKLAVSKSVIYNAFRVYKTRLSFKEKKALLNDINNLEIISVLNSIKENMPLSYSFLYSLLINKHYILLGLIAKIYQLVFGIVL